MYGVGWHQAWEKGKDISFYAPKNKAVAEKCVFHDNIPNYTNNRPRYDELSQKLPKVSNLYRERLPALLPAAGAALAAASKEYVLKSKLNVSSDYSYFQWRHPSIFHSCS
jgi:hypothetical protein